MSLALGGSTSTEIFREELARAVNAVNQELSRSKGQNLAAYMREREMDCAYRSWKDFERRRRSDYGPSWFSLRCVVAPFVPEQLGSLDTLYRAHREEAKNNSAYVSPKYASRYMYNKAARGLIEKTDDRFRLCFDEIRSIEGLIHYVDSSIDVLRQENSTGRATNAARALSVLLQKERFRLRLDERTAATFAAYALFQGAWSAKIAGDVVNLGIIAGELNRLGEASDDPYVSVAQKMARFYFNHLENVKNPNMMMNDAAFLYHALQNKKSSAMLLAGQSEAGVYHNIAGMVQYKVADDIKIAQCGSETISGLFARSIEFKAGPKASMDCWAHRIAAAGYWKIKNGRQKEAIAIGEECMKEIDGGRTLHTARVQQMIGMAKRDLGDASSERHMARARAIGTECGFKNQFLANRDATCGGGRKH